MSIPSQLLIKVCGMKYRENILAVSELQPDFLGFIFYPSSPRFIGVDFMMPSLPPAIKRTGVFVNEPIDSLESRAKSYHLNYIQLHGHESSDYCAQLKAKGYSIIKAFAIDEQFDFATTVPFQPFCDYFLFDTKGINPGGNGLAFNWEMLTQYTGQVPFWLSGGIGPDSINALSKFHHEKLFGIDLNSRFESEPAKKDIVRLQSFIQSIRNPSAL
ncbi:MAG: phosphoribosylanthranilate isomerase [Bacteroidetes bacterium]|nr:phosphoribosylanthranilate isomerase [Bacteroidota bacterium]